MRVFDILMPEDGTITEEEIYDKLTEKKSAFADLAARLQLTT